MNVGRNREGKRRVKQEKLSKKEKKRGTLTSSTWPLGIHLNSLELENEF